MSPINAYGRTRIAEMSSFVGLHSSSEPNDGRQKIGFHVESVSAVHQDLKAKGLKLKPLKNSDRRWRKNVCA